MIGVTLIVATVASAMVFLLSPIYSLVIYIASLAWYPTYLSVPIGTIDFTVRRIVILAIFANIFLRTDLSNRFKFIWLDKLIIIYFVAQLLAGATTAKAPMAFFENRAGAVFDMVLPYFAVRMIIQNKQQYLALLKGILIIAVPLAIIGFYQCLTGNNLAGFLKGYEISEASSYVGPSRLGLFRADVVFSHSIMYGLFFAMFGPVCAGILHGAKKYKYEMLCWIGLGLMGVGIFSSMSSGPMLATLLSIFFMGLYRWRKYWKPIVIVIIVMCGSVEIISNRHFYDVLGGFTLSPATAWYRSKLIDVALFGGMSDHWLTGFGYAVDPGWGPRIDGRGHTDMVNHYLMVLSYFGVVGLVPFLAMNVAVIKKLVEAYKVSTLDSDQWQVWCLSAGLFGLAGAMVSVSLFGQPTTIYYMMIGLVGVMPAVITSTNAKVYQDLAFSQR